MRTRCQRPYRNLAVFVVMLVTECGLATATPVYASGVTSATTHARCGEDHLRITVGPFVGGATQEEGHSLVFTNSGARTCVVDGYPALRAIDGVGNALPFSFSHRATGGYPMASRPAAAFTLRPDQSAYVLFAQLACVQAYRDVARRVLVSFANASSKRSVVLTSPLDFCRGANAAVENTIVMTPFEPTLRRTQ